MSSSAINYFALLAALVVGYGIFVSSTDSEATGERTPGVLEGYYLRDAVITETTTQGAPHFRVAAAVVAQNTRDDSYELTGLRVDYLKASDDSTADTDAPEQSGGAAHWVLNSDRGTASEEFHKLALRGNVQAHNLGAARTIVLDAPSLDIDVDKETASSNDSVRIGIEKSTVTGRGLLVDLRSERFTLDSDVGLKLAQIKKPDTEDLAVQIPESFVAESVSYDENKILTMVDVASKSPPFVKARELKASGTDIANNRIEMRGDVSVELPKSGALTADTAIVSLRNRRVARANARSESAGKLVEFQHRAKDSGKIIRGRARTIDYDVEQSALELRDNVWFQDDRGSEYEFEELDYNIATEAWRGTKLKATLKRNPKSDVPAVPTGTP